MLRCLVFLGFLFWSIPLSWGWRSELYPENWAPEGGAKDFYTDAFLQDFSHAGYRGGDDPIPDITGPVFVDVVADYGADSAGDQDSTLAIQAAIDAVGASGGGVVYLPAGIYRVSPQGANTYALRINLPNVVLRGAGVDKTFLFNTSVEMRSKNILVVEGPEEAGFTATGSVVSPITADLDSPTTKIPVANGSLFAVGDWVTVRADTTEAWIDEHKVGADSWWGTLWRGHGEFLGGLAYRRQVVAVSGNTVTLDVPTRYAVKTRDNARLVKNTHSGLTGVGLEDFSIGNQQRASTPGHEMGGWDTNDWNNPAMAAYQAHDSYAVRFFRARDCWMRRVDTYQPAGNTTTAHLLSNGACLDDSHRVTLLQCHFQRPQYGGAQGNGYMFRLNNSSDCLFAECRATFSRHGFAIALMRTSGNVLYRCRDTDTARSLGKGDHGNTYLGYETNGRGSDHHMYFSHSNLVDTCTADNSVFSAIWRPFGTAGVRHHLVAAHSVYWNTEGLGHSGYPAFPHDLVQTEQARYGYAIGTRGTRPGVNTLVNDVKQARNGGPPNNLYYTAPADWVEGVGAGNTLEPFSLYQDQVGRRLKRVYLPESLVLDFPNTSVAVSPGFLAGVGDTDTWTLVEGPGGFASQALEDGRTWLSFGGLGVYTVRLDAVRAGVSSSAVMTVTVQTSAAPTEVVSLPLLADSYIYDGQSGGANTNYGTGANLAIKSQGGAGYRRQIVQKFDLTPLQGRVVHQVTWKATANAFAVPANSWSFVTERIPATWTETGITWNNAPAAHSTVGIWQLDSSRQGSFAATGVVVAALGEGQTQIAFKHYDLLATATSVLNFPSKEAGGAGVAVLEAVVTRLVPDFAEWAEGNLPAGQRTATADPDGDGLPNAVEYVLGNDPGNGADASPLGVTAQADGRITLSYPLARELGEGVGVVVEYSTTLRADDWHPLSATLQQGPLDATRDLVVLDFQDDPGTPRRFFRLRVSLNDPAVEITTPPVGYTRTTLLGNSDTFTGVSLTRPPLFRGVIEGATDNTLAVRDADWGDAELAYQAGVQPNTYYVRIGAVPGNPEHPLEGRAFTVSGNVGNTLVLEVEGGDSLAGLPAGTPVTIIPHWTLDTLFPASDLGVSFEGSTNPGAIKTAVLFFDNNFVGINQPTGSLYFYFNNGWRKFGTNLTVSHGEKIVSPHEAIVIKNNTVSVFSLKASGNIPVGPQMVALKGRAEESQDHVLVTGFPVPVTLRDLNLGGTDGFQSSLSPGARRDHVFVYKNDMPQKNRSTTVAYYYMGGMWKKFGANVGLDYGDELLEPDEAFIIRKYKTGSDSAFAWKNQFLEN